jgi:CRISP-associated protein Cas1
MTQNDLLANGGNPARLLVKVTRDSLPQVKDKYPFIYLEKGRLEIDDSSVKWIDCDCNVVRLPVAMLNCILLGPGTTVTHEAVKVMASANCGICWVGEDSLMFYANGQAPTSNTRNLQQQMMLAANPVKSIEVARRLFAHRFPDADLQKKSLQQMMGMEGLRVRRLYEELATKYKVGWKGRRFTPGNFEMSDITNKILTAANAALYSIILSAVNSMGYSPHIGFIHSSSPLPFIYDLADLYKHHHSIDLAFSLTEKMAGTYERHTVATEFRRRIIDTNLLGRIGTDIETILGKKSCLS